MTFVNRYKRLSLAVYCPIKTNPPTKSSNKPHTRQLSSHYLWNVLARSHLSPRRAAINSFAQLQRDTGWLRQHAKNILIHGNFNKKQKTLKIGSSRFWKVNFLNFEYSNWRASIRISKNNKRGFHCLNCTQWFYFQIRYLHRVT